MRGEGLEGGSEGAVWERDWSGREEGAPYSNGCVCAYRCALTLSRRGPNAPKSLAHLSAY